MIPRRMLAVVLSTVVVVVGGVGARVVALEETRTEIIAQAIAVDEQAGRTEAYGAHLTELIDQADAEYQLREDVLAARPEFSEELVDLVAALDRAKGKVDTAEQRTAALAQQKVVLAEREDPQVIVEAAAQLKKLTEKIGADVKAWDHAQVRTAGPSGPRWSRSGADGYARVRAALDRVGGGGIGLFESGSCGGGSAPACANSSGYIKYRADIAGWSSSRLNWAMAHELAHIYQFRVWGALNNSSKYHSLFRGDPEFLANCMAAVRGFPGSVGCNGEQRSWASGIWVGAVR